MDLEERLNKIKSLTKMIIDLKNQEGYIETKKTIQQLQQEIDCLVIPKIHNSHDPFK